MFFFSFLSPIMVLGEVLIPAPVILVFQGKGDSSMLLYALWNYTRCNQDFVLCF